MIVALISPLYIINIDQAFMLCYLKRLKYMSQSKNQGKQMKVALILIAEAPF